MTPSQYTYLDQLARGVLETGDGSTLAGLSTGERCYVALAASRVDLLPAGYGIAGAAARLEPSELVELLKRWHQASR